MGINFRASSLLGPVTSRTLNWLLGSGNFWFYASDSTNLIYHARHASCFPMFPVIMLSLANCLLAVVSYFLYRNESVINLLIWLEKVNKGHFPKCGTFSLKPDNHTILTLFLFAASQYDSVCYIYLRSLYQCHSFAVKLLTVLHLCDLTRFKAK